ncbi:RrF2 family transcriptional regulator [Bacteroidota bacterium]
MSASTKLSTAVKALCYLAGSHPEPKSSTQISNRIGVNASKLRQLLSMLAKNQLVSSTKGTTGGFILQKDPDLIHLQEIYCAVEDRKAFHLDVNRTKGESAKETAKFNDYFFHLFADVQVEIEEKMKKISLGEVMKNMGVKSTYSKRGS